MKKLELLKKRLLNAKEALASFEQKNSRELTEEEKMNRPQRSTVIVGLEESEIRVFDLTKDELEEMERLKQDMWSIHAEYMKESHKNITISDVIDKILFDLEKLEKLAEIDMNIKLAEANFNGYKLEIEKRMAINDCINAVKITSLMTKNI